MTREIVVVGGGMVAHRFVEALVARGSAEFHVTVLTEESWAPYDRMALTSYFDGTGIGRDATALALGDAAMWDHPTVTLRLGTRVTSLDRSERVVETTAGPLEYDDLVLATGSSAFVPPVEGRDLPGCFVYRTVNDVASLRTYALEHGVRTGAVVGGGLLGLEAAGALVGLGLDTHVVEFAPRLMPIQVDEGGGEALRRLVGKLGVTVHAGTATAGLEPDGAGRVARMRFADGAATDGIDAGVVVFAAGVRARDELARAADLPVGTRGGVVTDNGCRTEDPHVWAIGECAAVEGTTYGLVAPGYTMAEVVVDRMLGGAAAFDGADLSTKLKLLGVDVASFGDAHAVTEGALEVVHSDPVSGVYKKLVVSDDAGTLLGGVLVGDASAYASLRPMVGGSLGADPGVWLLPEGAERPQADLPDAASVCSCNGVSAGTIRAAVTEQGCTDVGAVKACTRAGTSCGSCVPLVKQLVTTELVKAGVEVSPALCEHFAYSRAQLFDIVRVSGIRSFSELVAKHGDGRGCDICKPVVASILASLHGGYVLDGEQAALQDTNDHMLANIQKDGTYSVIPRIAGGEITPEKLIVIGQVAQDFGLYTKITGGQRIDLLGARVDQLPKIWKRLVDAGFESGHAYGKSVRTVKSCVGSTWCRYGVQDSVGMAIELELRYRGLRSPHKLKFGVSGCARECAEARGKDVGVIATEQGWNVYVGGNGGFTPRHARLLAEDLDDAGLIRTIDRFLMYYVRTADRLQRTAAWLEEVEGGLHHVRAVVLEDSLGIATDLDRAMATHVADYADEWATTLADPDKLRRFASFVNAPDEPDPSLARVRERGQLRPPRPGEREAGVVIAGPDLQVVTR